MSAALMVQHKNEKIVHNTFRFGEEELVGYWNYSVPNAPYEYSKGDLLINKEQDNFTVKIMLPGGSINAESVVVQGNKINFKVYVEGSLVKVALEAQGDIISGIAETPEGSLQIKGTKGVRP
ncbi:hypothetical protein BFP75_12815 [Maribacter sp. 4G9]|nr:hypothetical protein BFP75_12815 [Maribacter sp. 4G9]